MIAIYSVIVLVCFIAYVVNLRDMRMSFVDLFWLLILAMVPLANIVTLTWLLYQHYEKSKLYAFFAQPRFLGNK